MKQKKLIVLLSCVLLLLMLSACKKAQQQSALQPETQAAEKTTEKGSERNMEQSLRLLIDGTEVQVAWEKNATVKALCDLAAKGPLHIKTSMYGGFEQVGALGAALLHEDRHITTKPGDIMLYSGNQIVLFFGENSWSYTRLGKITGQSEQALASLLGNEHATINIFLEDIK